MWKLNKLITLSKDNSIGFLSGNDVINISKEFGFKTSGAENIPYIDNMYIFRNLANLYFGQDNYCKFCDEIDSKIDKDWDLESNFGKELRMLKNGNYHSHLKISFSERIIKKFSKLNIDSKDFVRLIIKFGIIMASQQFKFWHAPNIRINESNSTILLYDFESAVIKTFHENTYFNNFLDMNNFEKKVISNFTEKILKGNYPDKDKRIRILEYLLKYGINIENPIFTRDLFFKKGNFAKIFILNTFEKYFDIDMDYVDFVAAIDYRLPQSIYSLDLFPDDEKLLKIFKRIFNKKTFYENSYTETYLRFMSLLVIDRVNIFINKKKSTLFNKNYHREIDSILFLNSDRKIPHHYCITENY